LTTVPRLSTELFISFDLLLFVHNTFYINLLRFTVGEDNEKHGDYTPGIFQLPRSSKLRIITSLGSKFG